MKIFIIRDSQLSNANMAQAIAQFAAAAKLTAEQVQLIVKQQGGLPFDRYSQEEVDAFNQGNGAIWQYKIGKIRAAAEFRARLNAAMQAELSEAEFKKCWNAMCEIAPQQKAMIRDILDLQYRNKHTPNAFRIHIIASTNPMHQTCLAEQFIKEQLDLSGFIYTYSYALGALEPQKLLEAACQRYPATDQIIDLRGSKIPVIYAIKHSIGQAPAPQLLAAVPAGVANDDAQQSFAPVAGAENGTVTPKFALQ